MLNGEGLRVVLWLSHCSHNCLGCQNAQTHAADSGIHFDESAKKEIYSELEKDYISGITLSGGDPLSFLNRKQVLELVAELKEKFPRKNIWLYTGYLWDEVSALSGIENVDIVVDGKYIQSLNDNRLPYRGSTNQKLIDVKASLASDKSVEYKVERQIMG